MKKLLLYSVIFFMLMAISSFLLPPQDPDFDKQWEQVSDYVEKGLPRSALKIVDEIYRMAKNRENQPQLLKALIYRVSLQSRYEEDHLASAIRNFEDELGSSSLPEKQILHSLLAELYHWYYRENMWKINERGTLAGEDPADIHTWDAVKLNKTIHDHYLRSLDEEDELKEIQLDAFEPILTNTGVVNLLLRPTLYDLLAHRALAYFSTPEAGLADISNQLKLGSAELLAPAADFISLKPAADSASSEWLTISLYQRLLSLQLENKNLEALIDLDLQRLEFIYMNLLPSKEVEEQYITTLTLLSDNYRESAYGVRIAARLAQQYMNQGNKYRPKGGEAYRYAFNEAEKICRFAIDAFPEAKDISLCENLLQELLRPDVSIMMHTAEIADQPFLARVSFRNVTRIYFRIIRLDAEQILSRQALSNHDGFVTGLLSAPALQAWSQDLPDTEDHQQHAAEIRMPPLQRGRYVVFASTDSLFSQADETAYQPVWISNLSYVAKNNPDGSLDIYVLDRETGAPVSGAEVEAYERTYRPGSGDSDLRPLGTFLTDDKGYVSLSLLDRMQYGSLIFTLRKGEDNLHTEDRLGLYRQSGQQRTRTRTYFFTDRAIYRPGQTVYFKGIVVDVTGDQVEIRTGHRSTVELLDVNRKKISELDLVTNDYGSFQGSFVIPTGGLNGRMTLRDGHGSASFSAEEYKRPGFRVILDTVSGEYRVGDEIIMSGKAASYSGNPLIRASVKYRVVRQPIIMPYYDFRPIPTEGQEVEIAHGMLETDQQGNFIIRFEAEKDHRIRARHEIPYRFVVYADVTDITGEVRSATASVMVGRDAFSLMIDSPELINREESTGITISAINLNGAPVETSVTTELFALTPPDRLLSTRSWSDADIQLIPREEFVTSFPHEAFGEEDKKENWPKRAFAKETIQVKGKGTFFAETLKRVTPGVYHFTATAHTAGGDTVRAERFITVFSPTGKELPGNPVSWSVVSKTKAEPGETIHLLVGSAARKSTLYYEVVNGNEVVERQSVVLNKSQKSIEIPVKEAYRGNFAIRTMMVRFNRHYVESHEITVPYSNKKLDISLETYRDDLSPGKQESWKVKVSGPQGEALAAELMAGMYDASLDLFATNQWSLNLYRQKPVPRSFFSDCFRMGSFRYLDRKARDYTTASPVLYPEINWFGYQHAYTGYMRDLGMVKSVQLDVAGVRADESPVAEEAETAEDPGEMEMEGQVPAPVPPADEKTIPLRTNFNETAFFYPQLQTDSMGNVVFSFTTPDALTAWKMLMLATTRDLKTGTLVREFQASKDLMVMPNVPRFVRQGDELLFTAKIANLTDSPMKAETQIEFYDAVTMDRMDILDEAEIAKTTIDIPAGENSPVSWKISIPDDIGILGYRITASSGQFTDGEERLIPVLTNRMLVTESLPLPLKGQESRTFNFDRLIKSDITGPAASRKHYRYTVEFTSNPAWYAIQALPYLSKPTIENPGSLFHRYYANALAGFILNSNPAIKGVFESWSLHSPEAFQSNLQKNEELKNVLLEATPWILEAEDEAEQKRRIGILFDLNLLDREKEVTLQKLSEEQLPDGSWAWFRGMRPDRHTTQQIVAGFARLKEKRVLDWQDDGRVKAMVKKALGFLDRKIAEDYDDLRKNRPAQLGDDQLGSMQIEYLFLRVLLKEDFPLDKDSEEAFGFYAGQAGKYWLKKNNYLQGMLAVTLYRLGSRNEAEGILRSLKERSLSDPELGMYWRQEAGWGWFQAPVETQAMLIEAFDLVNKDARSVEQMKNWLLKQKQTNRWTTSSATAEAVFALLMTGEDLLSEGSTVKVKVGGQLISPEANPDQEVQAGTGYFKTSWSGKEITPDMGKIEVTNPNRSSSWGAAYWQYFEDIDRITAHQSPLSITKELFVEELTNDGPVITKLAEGSALQTGDKVVIRLVIRSDRDMEYVHVRDMRSSSLEPSAALSGFQWSGGLGFYRNIKDASTDFFIQYLQKGTYVLEYPLVVTQKGDFSNGIATIQSYYAPEFAAHSEGIRLKVR